ncbi:FirrV-1-A1 [Feldmannia irregularis virus a]|uniref:FirrV-1-A1 n=1 Tax=Feldmannia irregularis virus a TaxID=231992 RepID=Q6XM86_9PHYC|nr:FirrV-1-A1 [Feldmannia irregularis virus a]AAR26825.1 FirrV-1-A1 [Feldmannia irregularis virus a]
MGGGGCVRFSECSHPYLHTDTLSLPPLHVCISFISLTETMSSVKAVQGRTFVAETGNKKAMLANFKDLQGRLREQYERILFIGVYVESPIKTKIFIQCETSMRSSVLAHLFEGAGISLLKIPVRFRWPEFPSFGAFSRRYGRPHHPGKHGNGVKEIGREDISHIDISDIRFCLGSRDENLALAREVYRPNQLPGNDEGVLQLFRERLFFSLLARFETSLLKCRGRSVKMGTRANMNIRFGMGDSTKRFAFYDLGRWNIRPKSDFFQFVVQHRVPLLKRVVYNEKLFSKLTAEERDEIRDRFARIEEAGDTMDVTMKSREYKIYLDSFQETTKRLDLMKCRG